jgi:hypothetical protein
LFLFSSSSIILFSFLIAPSIFVNTSSFPSSSSSSPSYPYSFLFLVCNSPVSSNTIHYCVAFLFHYPKVPV